MIIETKFIHKFTYNVLTKEKAFYDEYPVSGKIP